MSDPPIALYVNFYTDKAPSRQEELVHCQTMNGKLGSIDKIHMIVNNIEQYSQWVKDYPKIQLHFMVNRPTFTDFFKLANQTQSHPKQINIISNTDIYFTSSLDRLKTFNWQNRALCLSRQDTIVSYSQDTWAWQGPMKNISAQSSFFLGVPGCDNRIAYVLHSSGYKLHNPAKTIIAHHVHHSMVRNYTESSRLHGNGVFIEPTHLGEHTNLHFTDQDDSVKSKSKSRSKRRLPSRSRSRSKPQVKSVSKSISKSNQPVSKPLVRSQSVVAVRNHSIRPLQRNHSVIHKHHPQVKVIKPTPTQNPHPQPIQRPTRRMTQRQQRINRINAGRKLAPRRIRTVIRRRRK